MREPRWVPSCTQSTRERMRMRMHMRSPQECNGMQPTLTTLHGPPPPPPTHAQDLQGRSRRRSRRRGQCPAAHQAGYLLGNARSHQGCESIRIAHARTHARTPARTRTHAHARTHPHAPFGGGFQRGLAPLLQLRAKLVESGRYKLDRAFMFEVMEVLFAAGGRGTIGSSFPISVASGCEPQVSIQMISLEQLIDQLKDHLKVQNEPEDDRCAAAASPPPAPRPPPQQQQQHPGVLPAGPSDTSATSTLPTSRGCGRWSPSRARAKGPTPSR